LHADVEMETQQAAQVLFAAQPDALRDQAQGHRGAADELPRLLDADRADGMHRRFAGYLTVFSAQVVAAEPEVARDGVQGELPVEVRQDEGAQALLEGAHLVRAEALPLPT